jgi:hypothetical protein
VPPGKCPPQRQECDPGASSFSSPSQNWIAVSGA